MSLFDRFRKAKPAPGDAAAVAQRLVVPHRQFVNVHALDTAGLRRGMHVMSAHGYAILTGARLDGMAEITLQKQDGTTRMELDEDDKAVPAVRVVEMDSLRAAHIEEIPTTRHEGEHHLRRFGYISASEA